MKVDITCAYYRQAQHAETFFWGMLENREHINQIFITNDEPWSGEPDFAIPEELDVVLLDHPHDGFGVAISINQGVAAAATEYIFNTSFDQILAPDALKEITKLAAPERMVIGCVDHIALDTTAQDLPTPEIVVRDWKREWHQHLSQDDRSWAFGHNGHTLYHRESLLALGGFDTSVCTYGRTCEDHELAVRWQKAYGPESIIFGPTHSWHYGNRHLATRAQDRPTVQSRELLARSLGSLYGQRYALFSKTRADTTYVNVAHETDEAHRADVRVDCKALGWLPDGTAHEIVDLRLPNEYIFERALKTHINHVARKLVPGGRFAVANKSTHRRAVKAACKKAGLTVFEDEGLEAYKLDTSTVCFDLFGLSDHTARAIDQLEKLKRKTPNLRATVYAYPMQTSQKLIDRVHALGDWVQLAPLGWRGSRNECLAWTQEEAEEKIKDARSRGFTAPVFRAPDWTLDAAVYNACAALGYAVASHKTFRVYNTATLEIAHKAKPDVYTISLSTSPQDVENIFSNNHKLSTKYAYAFPQELV